MTVLELDPLLDHPTLQVDGHEGDDEDEDDDDSGVSLEQEQYNTPLLPTSWRTYLIVTWFVCDMTILQ